MNSVLFLLAAQVVFMEIKSQTLPLAKLRNTKPLKKKGLGVIVPREILKEVIEKVKNVHPYEEVAFDIYPLENL